MKNRPTLKLRYFLIVFTLIIIGVLIKLFIFSSPDKPNFITASAKVTDLEQTVLADGSLKAFKQVSVGAQVSGQIKVLHVALGDRIKKDQPIAEIDDLPQQNNLKEAEASIKNLQAQKASKVAISRNNQLNFERQKKIVAAGIGVQAEYDNAKALLESTKADIESLDAQIIKAQIAVDTAKLNLGYTKIVSPIDGVVVAIPVEEGQTVNAVQSAPTIVKVAQLDIMTIEAQISEADVPKVQLGVPVYFTILGDPNQRFSATLRSIEPAPNSINDATTSSNSSSTTTAIYYNGLFDVPNLDGKLRISMTAQVYIVLAAAKNAIVIPATAIDSNSKLGTTTVQVVDELGKVSEREVTIGINNNIYTEILSGLKAGENVIISQAGNSNTVTASRSMRIRM